MRSSAVVVCVAVVVIGAACAVARPLWHELDENYSFEQYKSDFKKAYASEREEAMRRSMFEKNLREVLLHNSDPSKSWKEGINHMSDWTAEEFESLLGYARKLRTEPGADTLMHRRPEGWTAPTSVDWRQKGAITPVKDQGQCGSCWTFAATETIESAYFMKHGSLVELSEQQVASCTPNPKHCGGTGGCAGGTAEVAFAGVMSAGGIASEWSYPYVSHNGTNFECKLGQGEYDMHVTLNNYVRLEQNNGPDLMHAVATIGPIAISVDASVWSKYESGVFSGCSTTNATIDHAVQLVGYGTDPSLGDYWIVRNSWTPWWGESGFIRIKRYESNPPCAIDSEPGSGFGCDGGPTTISVCGMCGILSDSAYPLVN